jgi:hypothetical protein
MHHLVDYGDRLIQVEANFGIWQSDALIQHLFTALRSLGSHAMLAHLNIQCRGVNFGVEAAKSPSTDSWPALEEMLDYIPSLRKLQIIDTRNWMPDLEDIGRIQLRLPQTLTSLSLEVALRSFRKLLTPCMGLSQLKLCLPGAIRDELHYRDQVELDSLVSLQLEGYAIDVMDMLHLLRCDSLERVILILLDYPNGDGPYDHLGGSNLPNSTSFLSLKRLIVWGNLLPAVSTLDAISIPDNHALQLVEITVYYSFGVQEVIPVTLPDPLGTIPAERLEISAKGPTCAALLQSYRHKHTVRHLRMVIVPHDDDEFSYWQPLKLSCPRLLSLSIVAEDVSHIQELITYVHVDTDDLTLEIAYFPPFFGNWYGSSWKNEQLKLGSTLLFSFPPWQHQHVYLDLAVWRQIHTRRVHAGVRLFSLADRPTCKNTHYEVLREKPRCVTSARECVPF